MASGTKFVYMTLASTALAGFMTTSLIAQSGSDDWSRQRDRDRDRQAQQDRDRSSQQQSMNYDQIELQRLSRLMRTQVELQDGKQAGRIQDFGCAANTGSIVYAIVRVAEDSQTGQSNQQLKAVPYKALKFSSDGQTAKLDQDNRRWTDAPPFEQSWETAGDPKWGRIVFQHYGLTFDETKFTDRSGDQGRLRLISCKDAMQMNVQNRQNQELASIEDLMVDSKRGVVVYALAEPTQSAQGDGQFIAVPWRAFNVQTQQRVLVLDIERNELRNAPTIQRDQDLTNQRFAQRVASFYDLEPQVIYGYVPADDDRPSGSSGGRVIGTSTDDSGPHHGWDYRSNYGSQFDPNRIENFRCEIRSIERFTPASNMAQGVRMNCTTNQDRNLEVHLGPAWFIDRQNLTFGQGDQVQVTGSRVQVEGRTIIMATEIQHQNRVVILRNQNGVPRWDAVFQEGQLPRDNQGNVPPARGVRDRDGDFPPARGVRERDRNRNDD